MNIKKKILSLAIMSAMSLCTANAFADANVGTATVTVTGDILPSTCELDQPDGNYTLDLGNIGVLDLSEEVGEPSSQRADTEIRFTNCDPSLTSIDMTFNGTPDDDLPDYFKNTGDATGVAIDIGSGSDKRPGETKTIDIDSSTHSASDSFTARLVKTTENITPGTISGVITLDIVYK